MINQKSLEWQEIAGNWVLIPNRPSGIIHFLGGAFVATAPHLTYRWLLEQLGQQGYLIVATPFLNTLDHVSIAREVVNKFETTMDRLYTSKILSRRYLPIYGIGHSMGCKLHLLIGSLFDVERAGNIFISFNNYAASDAIPMAEQISSAINIEFTPSPQETKQIILDSYQVRRNLLIKFDNDTIDQSIPLAKILDQIFPNMISLRKLPGHHQTPLGQDINWQIGQNFTPLDAIGQWFKQEIYRNLQEVKKEILLWINPLSRFS